MTGKKPKQMCNSRTLTLDESHQQGYGCMSCGTKNTAAGSTLHCITLDFERLASWGMHVQNTWVLNIYCESCVPENDPILSWSPRAYEPYRERCISCGQHSEEGQMVWSANHYIYVVDSTQMLDVQYSGMMAAQCDACMTVPPTVDWQSKEAA